MTTYATPDVQAELEALFQSTRQRRLLLVEHAIPANNGVYRRSKDGRWYRPERRGLALVPIAERCIIARMGGETAQAMGKAHKFTPEQARAAGRLGGLKAASVPGRMAALGRKGGFQVSANREHMRRIGRLGGVAVSRDRKLHGGARSEGRSGEGEAGGMNEHADGPAVGQWWRRGNDGTPFQITDFGEEGCGPVARHAGGFTSLFLLARDFQRVEPAPAEGRP